MDFTLRYLDTPQKLILLCALLSLLTSFGFFTLKRWKPALFFLMLFSFTGFLSAAFFDPFLHLWDERFHALVAKSMINDPFTPLLYETRLLEPLIDDWSTQNVWLHKQPLFMWQMALSMKIFGSHEWAARLPDVVLATVLVFAFFRSGKLLRNETTGYLSALLFVTTGFLFELVSGRQMLDHNDFVFVSYVSLSVWSWLELRLSGGKKWIVLTGLFAGCAILCKWLPGLFVFLIWFIFLMINKVFSRSKYREMLYALLVTLCIALPWQIYIFSMFPDVAAKEFALNTRHFFEVIEGHDGTIGFHFLRINDIFGFGALLIIPLAWLYVVIQEEKKLYWISLLLSCVFVYGFFSIAKTKMPAFTALAIMPSLLAFAALLDWIVQRLQIVLHMKIFRIVIPVLLLLLCWWRLNPATIAKHHALIEDPGPYWLGMRHNAEIFREMILTDNVVIFNATRGTYLECMFYTGLPSYDFLPDQKQLELLRENGNVACIIDASEIVLPDYYDEYDVISDDKPIMKNY